MKWHLLTRIVLAIGLCAFGQEFCAAQHFSFSYGHHFGHGHHHGHHHCGPWIDFYAFPPPRFTYVYPAPPPVTYVVPAQPQVTVIQPAATPTPSSLASSRSAPKANSVPTSQRADVTLHNPARNGGPVAFLVQEQTDAELAPGGTRTWRDRTSLTVEFDRGDNFGAARKILQPGVYEFVVTDEGWDLVASASPKSSTSRSASIQRNSIPTR